MILKNGAMIATVWAESIPYWATASNVAILSLEKGDQVGLIPLTEMFCDQSFVIICYTESFTIPSQTTYFWWIQDVSVGTPQIKFLHF